MDRRNSQYSGSDRGGRELRSRDGVVNYFLGIWRAHRAPLTLTEARAIGVFTVYKKAPKREPAPRSRLRFAQRRRCPHSRFCGPDGYGFSGRGAVSRTRLRSTTVRRYRAEIG